MCIFRLNIHMEIEMRTNIDLDDKVVAELMALTGAKTKKEVVDQALRDQLRWKKAVSGIMSLRGKIEWEGDLDAMRRD